MNSFELMKQTGLTLNSAINHFRNELQAVYDNSELNQVLQIAFHHFFNIDRTALALDKEEAFLVTDFQKLEHIISLLKTNQPLAQIVGEWEFYGLKFKVNEHTLIPRPETEELIQLIVEENVDYENLNVLDIGTGTGCIPIALKNELKNANITAFDISEEALRIAKENSELNNLSVVFQQVDILRFEEYESENKFDVIVSNPPYIPHKEKELMHKNVLDFEPGLALFVDNDEPLIFYDRISDFALTHLKQNGKLYFEINENYGEETKQLLIDKGFKSVTLIKDMNNKDRIVKAIL